MLERIAENEVHRQRIHEQKEQQRREQQFTASDLHQQKLENIKAASEGAVQEKVGAEMCAEMCPDQSLFN